MLESPTVNPLVLVLALLAGPEETVELKNGLTAILRPVAGAKDVAVVVLFGLGGDHDPQDRSGLAHLLEHVYVTAAAGETPARTVDEYARAYPKGWNAQTGDRYTVLATVVAKESLSAELRDAAARMGDLRIADSDLARERPRLLQEIQNMFGGIPLLAARNLAAERVRPTPRGGRKGGHPEHVPKITLEETRARWKALYKPRNALVVVAGGFDPEVLRRELESQFGPLPGGDAVPDPASPGAPVAGPLFTVESRAAAPGLRGAVAAVVLAPSPADERFAPFLVLVSRMMDLWLKEGFPPHKLPLAFTPIDDPLTIAVAWTLEGGDAPEQQLAQVERILEPALSRALSPGDVQKPIQFLGSFYGLHDLPDAVLAGNLYGFAFGIGRRRQLGIDPAALRKRILDVKEEDLRKAAAEIFGKDRRASACVLPRE